MKLKTEKITSPALCVLSHRCQQTSKSATWLAQLCRSRNGKSKSKLFFVFFILHFKDSGQCLNVLTLVNRLVKYIHLSVRSFLCWKQK